MSILNCFFISLWSVLFPFEPPWGFMDAVYSCRYSFIRRLFLPITLRLGRKNLQDVHVKPANQARCSTFASDKTRAVRDGKAGREKQAARAAIKGKECSYKRKRVVGGGIWEADYKRTKTGDKDKGDSAPTVLSVRHFVHSNFGTRCFSIRGTILFQKHSSPNGSMFAF